ncbi:hypothetical protein ACIRBX_26830 [Kitasatospora sp. NPDC096147]|uniref:hypothetical protein n=1 Tax=Kitasatospora sp. NPDC096147 TaxID=3364093 RepID=UPI0038234AD1
MIWIKGHRFDAAQLARIPAAAAWAADEWVRDYEDEAELLAHLQGRTDHLGTLLLGDEQVWVRVPVTGNVVFAEEHHQLRFADLIPCLGIRDFVDESLLADADAFGDHLRAAYHHELGGFFRKTLQLAAPPEKLGRYGVESLLPKIAPPLFALRTQLRLAADPGTAGTPEAQRGLRSLTEPAHVWAATRYALRLAWALAQDEALPGESFLVATGRRAESDESAFGAAWFDLMPELDSFMTSLGSPASSGDDLLRDAEVWSPLHRFASRTGDWLSTVLSKEVSGGGAGFTTQADQEAWRLRTWREFHMRRNVQAAFGRGTRFVGLGAHHASTLARGRQLGDAALYDLRGEGAEKLPGLTGARTLTELLTHTRELRGGK